MSLIQGDSQMHGSFAIGIILVCVNLFRGGSRMHFDALCLDAAHLLTRVCRLSADDAPRAPVHHPVQG